VSEQRLRVGVDAVQVDAFGRKNGPVVASDQGGGPKGRIADLSSS
jgi:hypothetical protein